MKIKKVTIERQEDGRYGYIIIPLKDEMTTDFKDFDQETKEDAWAQMKYSGIISALIYTNSLFPGGAQDDFNPNTNDVYSRKSVDYIIKETFKKLNETGVRGKINCLVKELLVKKTICGERVYELIG